ncbi:MAG TPA: biotin--[acetyl-CoA-carboxylase] ligase [Verrucomicrobiae bacterium]|jgi:BirA family biotin operon repressor/biotin-[acetyl-CoA-carboxylase] ligase|nr:biotin--[acetyl-CoA-carboxylase] ligase [Verrucomicrobiae bacterium]
MTASPSVEGSLVCDGWRVHEIPVTDSTNLAAAKLSAWEAIRADRQTAGRGRFQRGWVSDDGGLWLSAVVPTGPNATALPLAVGLAVCDALKSIGLGRFRVRWPNDVLVDDRKLAGLLVDQFVSGLAVAGIGINVFNHPETHDAGLKNQTTRLADLIETPPNLRRMTQVILSHLRLVVSHMHAHGFISLLSSINQLWGDPRRVELDLDGDIRRGTFTGVGGAGELLLLDDSGHKFAYQAHQVRHLKEIA